MSVSQAPGDVMTNLIIRPYHPMDKEGVIALWQECHLIAPQNNPQLDIRRKLKVNPEWFLVGEIEEIIVASCMAGYDGHRGWINYLGVRPACRRQGIASKVLKEAEKGLRAAGCPKINLQIRETNKEVIRFYERVGYKTDPVLSMGKRITVDALERRDQLEKDVENAH